MDLFVAAGAAAFRAAIQIRIRTYRLHQAWLRRRYRVAGFEVRSYEAQVFSERACARMACTSGSTKSPKEIPYSKARVRRTLLIFVSAMFRNLASHLPANRSFFALTSTQPDASLTTMLTTDQGSPLYLGGLHAPHRMMVRQDVQAAIRKYGETAVRVWLMTVSNPGLLYATNPSTIATFLESIPGEWESIRRIAARRPELQRAFRRVESNGARERLQQIVRAVEPLSVRELFPGLRAFSCWDGGYVKPFLDRIRERLPEDEYLHVPMYSMSTETIETIAVGANFLPIAPGVLYEFIEPGKASLLRPDELRVGHLYTMIVSDGYGLRRYDTEDLFECVGFVRGIPDLRFARRRNLSFSFTGEKLTGVQIQAAFQEAAIRFPDVSRAFLTCFPSLHPEPCYRVVLVEQEPTRVCGEDVAAFVERRLRNYNHEFKAKIESGRLGHMRFERIPMSDFVHGESQFKFLPLYPRLWESNHDQTGKLGCGRDAVLVHAARADADPSGAS